MSQDSPEAVEQGAAAEAAQHVVEGVTSWEYAAEETQIAEKLTDGIAEAGVSISEEEKARLVSEIDAAKDETDGAPEVAASEVTPLE